MSLSKLLFVAATLLFLILALSFLLPSAVRPAADPHPDFLSLDRTSVGSQATLVWGYAMGLAILTILSVSVAMGIRPDGRGRWLRRWLTGGFACLALLFTALVVSYAAYAEGTGSALFLGLPGPTAWMLYGVWLFPLLMVVAAVLHFDGYLSDEDERRFDRWVRSKRSEREGDD